MRRTISPCLTASVVIVSAGLVATPAAAPASHAQAGMLRLTGADTADSALGAGTALVMGPSGFPIPSQAYVDSADALYLRPHGFDGTAQGTFIPNGLYPVTGVKSLTTDASFAQGQQILDKTILGQIAGGHVDAANPVVVFGWSQSSSVASLTMSQLAEQGVPSDEVHFVLAGNPSNPNGGLLERFDVSPDSPPSFPSLGVTFSGAAPDDLYPTDMYTAEYDGFADFPRYPINLLSDLNAFFGLILSHGMYLGFTPDQIASAIELPTVGDTMTHYYMIPDENLPLLQWLQLIPGVGQPLYDLLEPDTKILVDLGYGHVDTVADVENSLGGWDYGQANVPTTFGLFPENLDPGQLLTSLAQGAQLGITNAINDLQNPDQTIPWLSAFENEASALGFDLSGSGSLSSLLAFTGFPTSDTTLHSSLPEIINAITGTLSGDYATLLPIADTATAILADLPEYNASIFTDQLQAGNLLGAIGDPIAADMALVPFALLFGALAPVGEAALGTLVNLGQLFS